MKQPRRIHVIPIADVEIHSAQSICWCHPTEVEPMIWVHNAKDCREKEERVTGEKCSAGWINIAEYGKRLWDGRFLFD